MLRACGGIGVRKATSRLPVALISLAILLVGGLFALALNNILFSLELESLSFRQRLFSLPPKDRSRVSPIELIAMDEKTSHAPQFFQLFGERISRSAPAYVVRFLKRARPRAVMFDISFDGVRPTDVKGSRDLVESLQGTVNFTSNLRYSEAADSSLSFQTLPSATKEALSRHSIQVKGLEAFPSFQRAFTFDNMIPPFGELLQGTPMRFFSSRGLLKHADINSGITDASGDSRRWVPFTMSGGYVFPNFILGALLEGRRELTLERNGRLSWPGGWVDLGADGMPLIRWHGAGVRNDSPVYPEASFWDVILSEITLECREKPDSHPFCKEAWVPKEPLVNPDRYRDKYVLVGFTERTNEDVHKTIYGIRIPGIYIMMNILDNLLHRDFVYPAPFWQNALAFLLLPLTLVGVANRYRSVKISVLMLITLSLGYFLLCAYVYNAWNLWLNSVYPITAAIIVFIGLYAYRYLQEQKQRQQLRFAFARYVSPAAMQVIEKNPDSITLGGERREMSFLFCDIRGFTTYSDNNPPEAVQAMLTQYFSVMNRIILHDYHGSINKLIGDAIMAFWGFPLENEDHAFLAVSAALAMREAIKEWRQDPSKPPINIGIGINTGEAMIGNVGSIDFMDFTVIGDAVNVASRLESANKEYGTNIIISAATYEKVKDRISVRSLGYASIRGKEGQTEIFEPLGLIGSV